MKGPDKNTRLMFGLVLIMCVMIGIVAAAEPLYRMFCQATGYGGASRNGTEAPAVTSNREVTITFDSNVDSALPWDFAPEKRSIKVKLGETVTIKYRARNRGRTTLTGSATDNVQPDKAGRYFNKIQCFCFTKQTLKANETIELPVQFFVDPAMEQDPEDGDVQNITLSYTFYLAKPDGKVTPPS